VLPPWTLLFAGMDSRLRACEKIEMALFCNGLALTRPSRITLKYRGFSWMAVSSTAMTRGEFRRHFDFFTRSHAGVELVNAAK
jgi:hypothetical protein